MEWLSPGRQRLVLEELEERVMLSGHPLTGLVDADALAGTDLETEPATFSDATSTGEAGGEEAAAPGGSASGPESTAAPDPSAPPDSSPLSGDIYLDPGGGTGPPGTPAAKSEPADGLYLDAESGPPPPAGDNYLPGRGTEPPGSPAAKSAPVGGLYLDAASVADPWTLTQDIDLNTGTGTGPEGVIRILGDNAGDRSGRSVSSAGDVNGDGYEDFLIGACLADPAGGSAAGETYLVFGQGAPWSDIDLDTGTGTGPPGVIRILGDNAGDWSGYVVAPAGDVNGDGYDDFLIGAYGADPAGGSAAGETYLIFGHDGAWSDIDLNTGTGTGPAGVIRILGDDASDWSGYAVASAGDVNGDGYADFLIGAPGGDPAGGADAGEVYLIFGHAGPWADIDLNTGTGTGPAGVIRILGDDAADWCGFAVSSAGDVNGDGYADFLIGALGGDPAGGTDAGEVYLIFGHDGPWADIDLNTGTGTGPAGVVRIFGDDANDWSGYAVASAGDVNGDGYDDFLIGACLADPAGGTDAGEVYLVFGHGGPWSDIDLNTGTGTGPAGVVRIFGDDANDWSGYAVASAGDVNGDGYDDFLIGAYGASPAGGTQAGEAYLIFGHGGSWSNINLNAGSGTGPAGVIRILGDDEGDLSGFAVASAGDVNNDGCWDILVGAWAADPAGGAEAGETYLIFGAPVATATAGHPVTFTDADGDLVTVSVTGPGRVDLCFTGPAAYGADIARAQITGGTSGSRFTFTYTGSGNGVQITELLDVDSAFKTVRVQGDVNHLDVTGHVASTLTIDGTLAGGAIGGDIRGNLRVGRLSGDLTIGDDIEATGVLRLGEFAEGVLRVTDDVKGLIEVTGNSDGHMLIGDQVSGSVVVGGDLIGALVAGGTINSVTAANIYSPLLAAGFEADPGTETFWPSGVSADIRRITLTGGDIVGAVIAASDDLFYYGGVARRLSAAGGGIISNTVFSAGFGPGPDGVLGTSDDVILSSDGRIGNIGSASLRFAAIDGKFVATGNIYDINSAGKLGDPEDVIYSLKDIDDLRAGGDLQAWVIAGDDIDSITAANINCGVIAAGFYGDIDSHALIPSGMAGDIRRIALTGSNITDTMIVASDDILYDDATGAVGRLAATGGGTLSGVYFSAGFGPGADGEFGTGDDVVLYNGRIGNIGSASVRFAAIEGSFVATGGLYDINSAGNLGHEGDLILSLRDIDDLRAGGDLKAYVIAGDDIDSITAANISCGVIAAGFYVDVDTRLFAPSGLKGDIRRIALTGSDITYTMIVASDDILYTDRPQTLTTPGGGVMSGVSFLAGFGPGPDGEFGTIDDPVLGDGRIGNIGSAANRFSDIDAIFRATGNIYDINTSGELSGLVWSMRHIDDIRVGTLGGSIAAGGTIDSIVAVDVLSHIISAGYAPGPNGLFEMDDDDVLTGLAGDIRSVTVLGNVYGAQFRASRDIGSITSAGQLGTLGFGSIFAGDDIGILRSGGDIGAAISAGTISGSGVIGRIEVDEPNDLGGPDPTILGLVFANLRIDYVKVEAATGISHLFTGVLPTTLILDSDADGA